MAWLYGPMAWGAPTTGFDHSIRTRVGGAYSLSVETFMSEGWVVMLDMLGMAWAEQDLNRCRGIIGVGDG